MNDRSASEQENPGATDAYEIDLSPYLGRLRRGRGLIIGAFVVGGIVAGGISRLLPAKYTSDASFLPQTSQASSASALAGVASQLGLSLPSSQTTSSPSFYADLVTSRGILDTLAQTPLSNVRDGGQIPVRLIDKYGGRGTPTQQLETAVSALRKRITANVVVKTGVVGISVTTDSPTLSAAIVRRILELVSAFNLRTRQSQANSEGTFVASQMDAASGDLHAAEDRLRNFLATNQQYRSSSEAAVTHDRLERDVNLKQQLYTTLAEALQRARIEEVRNTPVIMVIDPPSVASRGRHGTVLFTIVGSLIAMFAATVYALMRVPR